ncbi:MAG TPA: phosphatidylglycerophosphatase A [Pyrinomonadaceae bacterium]|nr:phosphatidylglycerophosphatase A [Pyrinomonadaceae bacterium]
MVIKESSDELNPPQVASAAAVTAPRPARSAKDYLALAIATCGVGYLPLAPGTWGSLVGIGVYFVIRGTAMKLFFDWGLSTNSNLFQVYYGVLAVEIVLAIVLSLVGTWAASQAERFSKTKDPGIVVIDEVAGQYIALLPLPFLFDPAWWTIIVAFVLFRFFDIVKPYPARRLEDIKGGLGIMADDLVAGVYAGIGVMLIVCISWFI